MIRFFTLAFLLCTLSACFAACGSSTPSISASDYLQTCTTAGDCASIFEGPIDFCCGSGVCDNAAINRSALAQYEADENKLQLSVCSEHFPQEICPAYNGCVPRMAACTAGKCQIVALEAGGGSSG